MSLREQAIRGAFWSGIQNWGSALLGAGVFIVLARTLDTKSFGLLALAALVVNFMEIFLRQGFGQAIVQRQELETGHLDTAFWMNVVGAIVMTLVAVTGGGLIAAAFHEPDLSRVIRWLSLSLLIGALNATPQALLQRRMMFKSLAIRSLVAVAGGGVVGITMALTGCGVWSLVGQHLTAAGIGTVVLWTASGFRPGLNVSRRHFRDLFGFGVYIIGADLLAFLTQRWDRLVIGLFLSTQAVGFYDVAQRLLTVMTQVLTQTLSTVAFAAFSRLQQEKEQMRHALYTTTRLTSAIAFPAFLGMAVLAPELVRGLFGPGWEPSIPVMRVLALVGILQSVGFLTGGVMLACGKPSWRLAIMVLNLVVNVAAMLLAVRWGILAVAAAYAIRGFLLWPLSIAAVRILIGVDPRAYLQSLTAPLVASLVMVAAVAAVQYALGGRGAVFLTLAAGIMVGALTYVLAVYLLAPDLAGQVQELFRAARRGGTVGETATPLGNLNTTNGPEYAQEPNQRR